MNELQNPPIAPPVASPLMAQFLYRNQPSIDYERLTEAVEKYVGRVDPRLKADRAEGVGHFVMIDSLAEFTEGFLPTQMCLLPCAEPPKSEIFQDALRQTWGWNDARTIVEACSFMLVVTDLMASPLDRHIRDKQFRGFMKAVQETIPADAIHRINSQVILNPSEFLRLQEGDRAAQMEGSINIRLFRIEGADNECLMDTMGLSVFGLPDVQCHFRTLECSLVSNKLFNIALYLFEHGDVIEDGHTVPGLRDAEKWRCQHESALVGPERIVLDLNPGPPYAAGGRKQ